MIPAIVSRMHPSYFTVSVSPNLPTSCKTVVYTLYSNKVNADVAEMYYIFQPLLNDFVLYVWKVRKRIYTYTRRNPCDGWNVTKKIAEI